MHLQNTAGLFTKKETFVKRVFRTKSAERSPILCLQEPLLRLYRSRKWSAKLDEDDGSGTNSAVLKERQDR
jgi:hypothetical protein